MAARPRILVLLAGAPGPAVRAALGGFDRWFAEGLAPAADVATCTRADLPAPDAHDGVVVTGSYASVTERAPWMERAGEWLLEAARTRPVLGVCFGHQLLAHALGGAVERNLRGPEVGTREVELTDAGRADPLFAGLPARFAVQETHEDHVPAAPPGATVLARNDHAPVQAFAHGPRIRAVQFHPEFSPARVRAICDEQRAWLDAAGPRVHGEAIASLRETPEATGLLVRWVERFVVAR
jgi:GMP synthase (glutamine-hydrolysing)